MTPRAVSSLNAVKTKNAVANKKRMQGPLGLAFVFDLLNLY